ncbi:hypothetical protein HHK36_028579 [Tetracentron sinense]|uniref:RPN1 N-terminal domain-containing protein n=1 Tax=Tetracentron sinense TaxID=13715 RepID=A0A835D0Q6_TETSI|nr:hypothetical protein HHK36_028579 [Tetracentron sinense]
MTSVPKPLKFLRPHYGTLKAYYETMGDSDMKKYLADILSVLALTMSAEGEWESLKYRLLGSEGDIGSWGHEYVSYLLGPDDMLVLDIAYLIYLKFEGFPSALRIALFLDNMQYVKQVFTTCDDLLRKKQFCYILARHISQFHIAADDEVREALQEIINNTKLSEGYLILARDIEVMEPKSPEDIYKVWLLEHLSFCNPLRQFGWTQDMPVVDEEVQDVVDFGPSSGTLITQLAKAWKEQGIWNAYDDKCEEPSATKEYTLWVRQLVEEDRTGTSASLSGEDATSKAEIANLMEETVSLRDKVVELQGSFVGYDISRLAWMDEAMELRKQMSTLERVNVHFRYVQAPVGSQEAVILSMNADLARLRKILRNLSHVSSKESD